MTTKKRYQTGEHESYDNAFVRLKNQSIILNSQNAVPNTATQYWDKVNLLHYQDMYKGDDDGTYLKRGQHCPAFIPDCKRRLAEIDKQFADYQRERVNEGYDRPEEMTEEMQNRKYELEAELDVLTMELEKTEERLQAIIEEEEEAEDRVLQSGLKQVSQLRHGKIISIDGQKVSEISDGLFVISDKRSPYFGMAVRDYRKLANKWSADQLVQDAEELKRIQQRAIAQGLPVPQGYVSSFRLGSFDQLPAYPSEFKRHLKM